MEFSKRFNELCQAVQGGPWKITGAQNNYYMSAADVERNARPIRVESLVARKSLFGNWMLIRDVQSPSMPVAHIPRRGFFGTFAGYDVDDSARRTRREIVTSGLSYKDAFEAVRAAEIAPPVLQLTSRGVQQATVLVQHCPEQKRSYWRNLAVQP